MDVVVDNRQPEVDTDVEETIDAGLKPRTRHQYYDVVVPDVSKVANGDERLSDHSTYLDIKGAFDDLDMHKILNVVQNREVVLNNVKGEEEKEIVNASKSIQEVEEEFVEEEIVELEFEKAIPKLNTHSMHCPNCDHQITKVILRRKIKRPPPRVIEEPHKPLDLLGCFSCFSLFTSSDNGRFNPFPIFWNKQDSIAADENVSRGDGSCFSIFHVFRKEKDPEQPKPERADREPEQPKPERADREPEQPKPEKADREPEQPKPENFDQSSQQAKPGKAGHESPSSPGDTGYIRRRPPIRLSGQNDGTNVEGTSNLEDDQLPSHLGEQQPGKDETSIYIPSQTSELGRQPERAVGRQDSASFEILKSVVYGGLMEVIASLSVVASASAGGASTLSIIALALANLVGGVIVVGHNLWDLRDDCTKYSSQETSDQEARNKYKELLGQVEHFPMHLFFAVLSFLVFGIIPPLAYGYSFQETNDKDFTMAVVAIASLVGVGLLSIFKAYIDRCNGFAGYFKTIAYYLTTAIAVSGVSYVAGNLAMRLIEKLGLFETGSGVAMSFLPEVGPANPALAYY